MKVLFVCHANVCRSFMAQEFLKKIRPDVEAFSRGIYVDPTYYVPEKVLSFLAAQGISVQTHIPTQLSAQDMNEADLVLFMEQAHLDQVLDRFAEHTDKCHLLLCYALGREEDLIDPIGLTGRAFEKSATALLQAVQACAKRLI